ncbi:MAG: AmmeMemoRadiSam system protein B, partial [Elusimicrobiota bacterium]
MIKLALACALWAAPAVAQIRNPAVAGQFYPADAKELGRAVDSYLAKAPAPAKLPGPIVALVVPHAGYEFSAPVAAHAYKAVSGAYDTVVVIGAAHTAAVAGAALYAKGAFATPLGPVPVDEELAARLLQDSDLFQDDPRAHSREHSVEVQLPFLIKRLKPGWKLLPLIMNTEDPATSFRIGQALARELKGRKALLVASSDLSHYPPAELADRVDRSTLKALERLDPQFFWLSNRIMLAKGIPGLSTTWCGEAAVLAALTAAKSLGADQSVLLRYANSGTSPHGDQSRTVGYAAMALLRSGQPPANEIILDAGQRKNLLTLTRDTLKAGLAGRKPAPELAADPVLNLPSAVFVTLTEAGRLRGC